MLSFARLFCYFTAAFSAFYPMETAAYMAIQPRAFATELTRMMAAKMGHR